MVQQAEILKDDANSPAQGGQVVLGERGGVPSEDVDGSAGRRQGKQHEAEQSRLARA